MRTSTPLLSFLLVLAAAQRPVPALACGQPPHAPQSHQSPQAPNASRGLVAHEWGTFTSVQDAGGALLQWNPLETSKLPAFVHDWSKPGLNRRPAGALNPGTKSVLVARQRMETPVIYFYTDRERTVDVLVRFPHGLITEWFPQAQDIGPSTFAPAPFAAAMDGWIRQAGLHSPLQFAPMFTRKGVADSRVHWSQVRVLPAGEGAKAGALPADSAGNHYYAARETDADVLAVPGAGKGQAAEFEKFLFYRGVANFTTPLRVSLPGSNEERFDLQNTGTAELRHLFLLSVRDGRGRLAVVDRLAPGESASREFRDPPAPLDTTVARLGAAMKDALVGEGLYEREAAAMVETWRPSWFEETGLRVLYILPRAWTDETLPLAVHPAPAETVRVMVGRAEILRPSVQWELLRQIVRYSEGGPEARQHAVAGLQGLGLGRFLRPAVQSVLGAHPGREFSQNAWDLVWQAAKTQPGNALAAK